MIASLAVAVAFAFPAAAQPRVGAAPGISFDQGVDAKSVLQGIQEQPLTVAVPSYAAKYTRWSTRDCVDIALKPGGPTTSEAYDLTSTDWEEDCYWTGDPRYGGGRQCHDRPGRTHHERVRVDARGSRDTYPWEIETFEACLESNWLTVRPRKTAYQYDLREDPADFGRYIAIAGSRQAMDPDASGITATLLNSQGGFALDLADRWATYYKGERTAVHAELWRKVEGWFDSKAATVDVELSPAANTRVGLTPAAGLETGKKYYVKWSFRRLGRISKDTEMKGNKTAEVVYQPSLSAGLGR